MTSPATNIARGLRGYTDFRSLITANDVDAVLIASPVHAHAEQAVAALAAGKHVYLEKPLATTAGECRQIREAARRAADNGIAFQVGLQRRYNPCYQQSMRFVHSGDAGRVLFVRAQWHATGVPPKNKAWLFRRSLSGGMAVEQASHQFDVFNWLFRSTPRRACGLGGTNRFAGEPPSRDTMDHYSAIIEYDDAEVHLSHLSYAVPERRFSGIYELAFAEKAGVDLTRGMVWTASGENRSLVAAVRGNDTERAVLGFLECACTGTQPLADIEVGYRATVASLLCRQALETGRTVTWKEVDST